MDDNTIERSTNSFWIGALYENKTSVGLILHSGCPYEDCVNTPVYVQLDDLGIQCSYDHSGILCGTCKKNYSLTFDTLHCHPCSSAHLALLLPFALAGIVLVVVVLLLNYQIQSAQ